ncbi:Uma2 family endonuclease [Streptosporangium subroseum]|uniref:Uma2 family endonuclease n=1 Tax=Streptosporangium subroseum TaxID=106412 RepID=UPI0030849672|nr:Uma2 family endonuclease [Streptosporangium subroseum]
MVVTAPKRSGQHTPAEEQLALSEERPIPRTPREFFDSLPPTLCLRAEIIDGNLMMSPSGTPQHARTARRLSRALIPVEDKNDWESFSGDVDVCIEGPRDILVPGYCLAPVNAPLWGDRELLSSALIMVAEIVSPGSMTADRIVKPGIYAGCGIPIMLIIDLVDSPPTITVLSDPVEGTYRTIIRTEMGKPVRLPSPVDFDLDTSIFL